MADNTNYIGVAMGLDVTDLKAGLSEANKQIQLANSEFKAASSGMDDWTKSTEGLTAKVKQLDTVLDMQKKKLSGLQAEYEKVVEEQGENSEAARKLKVQLNNQQAVVNKTQKEFDNFSDVLKQAEEGTLDLEEATINAKGELKKLGKQVEETADDVEDLGDESKDAGDSLEDGFGAKAVKGIAGGLAVIGGACVALIGSFLSLADSTRETRSMMNKLEAQFTTSGLTAEHAADTYSDLYGVLGDTGRASEAAAFLGEMADSEEELAGMTHALTGVWAKWGESIAPEGLAESINHTAKLGEVNGTLADALEWSGVTVDAFNEELAKCSNEQERQELIVDKLNGLYGEQADAYKELNKDIIAARKAEEEMNLALAELGAIAEPIMTTIKQLATDVLKEITPFVQLIGEGLQGALNGSADATDKLAEGIGGILQMLVERFTELIPTVLQLILDLVPSIANTLLEALPSLLQVITDLVGQIMGMLTTLLPEIVLKIVEIIPILIEQLVAAIPQVLEAFVQLLLACVKALPIVIEKLLSALPGLIDTILSVIIEAFPLLLDGAIQLFNALIDALPVIIEALLLNLPRVVQTIIDFLIQSLPLLLNGAITLLMAIIDALPVIIKLLVKEVPKIVKTISDTLLKNIDVIVQCALDLFFAILEAIPEISAELIKQAPDIITSIVEGLIKGLPDMLQAGKDLMGGLVDGIFDFDFKKAISGLGDKVVGAFNKVFDSHSPSRLIEDKVGVNVGEAIVPSRQVNLQKIKKRLGAFSEFVSENLGNIKANLEVSGSAPSVNRFGGGRGNTVINNNQVVNYNGKLSRKQLKQTENDNYTALLLRLKSEGAI